MTDRMAQNFMRVAIRFKSEKFSDLSIAPSALYLLAAPSTPDEAVDEALDRAAQGEKITHHAAQEIVSQHKPSTFICAACTRRVMVARERQGDVAICPDCYVEGWRFKPGTQGFIHWIGRTEEGVETPAADSALPENAGIDPHARPDWLEAPAGPAQAQQAYDALNGAFVVEGIYDLILADPPWHFQNWSADEPGMVHDRGRGANNHYPTMLTADICDLPVGDIAAPNAVLFMWACWPLLPDALQVIQAWGFEYKSLAWVWVKTNPSGKGLHMGMGYWTRANSEPCLLATRGDGLERLDKAVLSVIMSPVREHSRKPDEQYVNIQRLFGDVRRVELFARARQEGWHVYGNEVEESINLSGAVEEIASE